MSDAGEKSFDATPARVAKARREGNTARAGELGANLASAGALAVVPAIAPALAWAARSALHRSLTAGDMRRIAQAAFVVCNPTHVAVALAYRPPDEPVPRVLIRAAEEAALEVRRRATECGIPIVENVALVRALYERVRAGETIAHDHYVAVAEIVAALMRSRAIAR